VHAASVLALPFGWWLDVSFERAFNAVATWLDPILGRLHHGSASGYLFAILTRAGIFGAAILPEAAAQRDRPPAMLLVTVGVTAVAFGAISVWRSVVFIGMVLFVEGFVLLAALPVVLGWSELHTGPERAGAAVGFLLLAGNLGEIVLLLVVHAVIGNPYASLAVLAAAGLGGLALATRLPARAGQVGRPGPPEPVAQVRRPGPPEPVAQVRRPGPPEPVAQVRRPGPPEPVAQVRQPLPVPLAPSSLLCKAIGNGEEV
jgi:hypothetical protein